MYDGCAPMSFGASALGALAPGPGVGGADVVVDVIGTAVVLGVDGAAVALNAEGVAVALDVDVAAVADGAEASGTSRASFFAKANR